MTNKLNLASVNFWRHPGPSAAHPGGEGAPAAAVAPTVPPSTVALQVDASQSSTSAVRTRLQSSLTPCVRGTLSTALGLAVTGITTWVLVASVRRAIIHQKAPGTPQDWLEAGRSVYDNCYNGCNDCDDTEFALKACKTTAQISLPGINCDGAARWNWLERYPDACMQAFGENAALAAAKQKDRNDLTMIILTVAAGLVVGMATYKLLGCIASRAGARRGAQV